MNLTFTGTRKGMNQQQVGQVMNILSSLKELPVLFHGACHGADRQAHRLINNRRELFPSNLEQYAWAMSVLRENDTIHGIQNPIQRNRKMVNRSQLVIAAPSGFVDIPRGSGTWATIRYTFKKKLPICVCWPDGTVSVEYKDESLSDYSFL